MDDNAYSWIKRLAEGLWPRGRGIHLFLSPTARGAIRQGP
jgi:hypothetical protein